MSELLAATYPRVAMVALAMLLAVLAGVVFYAGQIGFGVLCLVLTAVTVAGALLWGRK